MRNEFDTARDYFQLGINASMSADEFEARLKEGLEKFPGYRPLWIKACDFFRAQSLQQGQRVISKAMHHFPNSREIVQIYAMTTHARANELIEVEDMNANIYFADAEQGYYQLARIEGDEPKIYRDLQRLYEDWGEDDLAATCAQALGKDKTDKERAPHIEVLTQRKLRFSTKGLLARIQQRLTTGDVVSYAMFSKT